MLNLLREATFPVQLDSEFFLDLCWWRSFLPIFPGFSLLKDPDWSAGLLSTDSSLQAAGAFLAGNFNYYISVPFPCHILDKKLSIHCLEILSLLVAVKQFGHLLPRQQLLIDCDNAITVQAINTHKSRDRFVQTALRELWFLESQFHLTIRCQWISSKANLYSDLASRMTFDPHAAIKFHELTKSLSPPIRQIMPSSNMFDFNFIDA